jgi:prepilin-type processing-associated H-X9-DG protein
MDYWYIGSPQADPCACNGGTGGTEFTEAVGTGLIGMNSRKLNPTMNGVLMETSFGSYHPGGAYFGMCDGSAHFVSETMELRVYQYIFSRNGKEPNPEL